MEKDKKIMWIGLALTLIGVLLLAFIIISIDYKKESPRASTSQIINSYNTYTINNYQVNQVMGYNTINPIVITPVKVNCQTRTLDRTRYHYEEEVNYFDYRYYSGQDSRKGILGSYVQEYYVYVLNKERTGEYFTVVFELEDKNGYEYSESVTKYIRAGEKERFSYRDIQSERNEIVDWDYRVIAEEA